MLAFLLFIGLFLSRIGSTCRLNINFLRQQPEPEFLFKGRLERCREELKIWRLIDGREVVGDKKPPPPNAVETIYYWYFSLEGKGVKWMIRTQGSSKILEDYLGEIVQIKGKSVAVGPYNREIWPGKIMKAE
jgi:hypothetical protein